MQTWNKYTSFGIRNVYDKIPLNAFNFETRTKIIEALRMHRFNTKRAYELNIPEDNFTNSQIQLMMSKVE
jgi:hypothetical protein